MVVQCFFTSIWRQGFISYGAPYHAAAAAAVASVLSDSVRPHRRQPTRLPRPWDSPGKNTGVGCHFLLQCMKVKSESEVAQSSDPQRPHGLQPSRLLHPWDFPGKSTRVGCHCLLWLKSTFPVILRWHQCEDPLPMAQRKKNSLPVLCPFSCLPMTPHKAVTLLEKSISDSRIICRTTERAFLTRSNCWQEPCPRREELSGMPSSECPQALSTGGCPQFPECPSHAPRGQGKPTSCQIFTN